MKHAYLKSSIWYREKIEDPYQVITDGFSAAKVSDYRKDIKCLLQAACADHVISNRYPSDMLCLAEYLESLINAAWLISREKKKRLYRLTADEIISNAFASSPGSPHAAWNSIPRLLSNKQLANPHRVIQKFFRHKNIHEWKAELQCLLQYALSPDSIFEAGIGIDTLCLYVHLVQLTEALYLIGLHSENSINNNASTSGNSSLQV